MKTVYRVARTRGELEAAFSLVFKEYQRRDYISQRFKSKLRLSTYNALPAVTTFVGMQNKTVAASVTLIPDSKIGLPMDKLYKKELDELRAEGRSISEVSQLAINTSLFGRSFFSMFNFNKLMYLFKLFKTLLDYALDIDHLTDLCIAINPRHQCLYKLIYFEQIGGLKHYSSVNRAPALAFRLNLVGLEERCKGKIAIHKIFYGNRTDPSLLTGKFKMKADDLKYFFIEKSDIFKKAPKEHLSFIKSCYPEASIF